MDADHVLEDLADGEEKSGSTKVHWIVVSKHPWKSIEAFVRPTHWSDFAEHSKNQHSFQDEEYHNEDERHELVKGVKSVCPVVRVRHGVLPVVGESEASVKRNVASADKECSCRAKDKANGGNGAIVEYLVADHSVHEQNPKSGHDRCNVNGRESDPYGTTEGEPANCEDLTYRDDDVAHEEKLHLPVRACQL